MCVAAESPAGGVRPQKWPMCLGNRCARSRGLGRFSPGLEFELCRRAGPATSESGGCDGVEFAEKGAAEVEVGDGGLGGVPGLRAELVRWISGARERQGGGFTEAQRPGAAEQGAARRGCTVAAARVVRVGSRGSGWFKEPWPKISACGIGRKGCGHRGRGSRGDTARPLQRREGGGRGRDCQVGHGCRRARATHGRGRGV